VASLIHDLVFAVRYLWRRLSVTLIAVAMLALGIGAVTAMFTVVDGVLLRALPYPAPARVVTIWQTFPHWRGHPELDAQWNRIALSYQEYARVAALDRAFESVGAAYWRHGLRLTAPGDPAEVAVARGSASLLPLLGIRPALGRWFLPGEEGAGAPALAVIPYAMWQERFGGSIAAIGAAVTVEDRRFEIVGVLPAEFPLTSLSPFATDADRQAIWTPLGAWSGDLEEGSQNYEVVARLRPGVVVAAVEAEVAAIVRGQRNPAQHDARVIPRQSAETAGVRSSLLLLFAAVALLLAITCGNLAALLLGEAALREREIRTRLALGAGAGRIIRQVVTEHALLSTVGAAAALPLAAVLTRALLWLSPATLPRADFVVFDWRAAAFAAVAATLATLTLGAAPALALARTRLTASGADTRAVSGRNRLQHGLIAAQVALSTVLLIAAGLLVRTLLVEQQTQIGFDASRLLTVSINASAQSDRQDRSKVQRFYEDLIARVRAIPGVVSVTSTTNVPISGFGGTWAVSPDPSVKLGVGSPSAQHDEVLPGFFEALGVPIVAGRSLNEGDRAGAPLVAVINETMARQLWPRESALGKPFLAPNGGVRTVVGIAADIRERGLARPTAPTLYESVRQVPQTRQTLLVRTASDPSVLVPEIRRAIAAADPRLPIEHIASMDEIIWASMAPERYRVLLVGFFAASAALMTVVGIAGVASRAVGARMRELCIRMAIGATTDDVIGLVVVRYVRLAVIGVSAGAAAAVVTMRVVEAYLVGVTTRDPLTYGAVAVSLAALAAVAGWLAARRLHHARIASEIAG
jgi:predicted permease